MAWVAVLTPIIVAIIGGPTMWMLYKFDKKNSADHAVTIGVLGEVRDNVREVKKDMRDLKDDHRDLLQQHRDLRNDFLKHQEGDQ
jgi:uncharacterized membrane-anchored protein